MNWKRWKLGIAVAIVLSGLVAASGIEPGMHWQTFVKIFATACLTHLGAFLNEHPIEKIEDDKPKS